MKEVVSQFLQQFLRPQKHNSKDILKKLIDWVSVYNNPRQFYPDASDFELRAKRHNARQNVRRTLKKHPELIAAVTRSLKQSEVQP